MLFRLELEHPIVRNKSAAILYGFPETILVAPGVIHILWTQCIGKKMWAVTFHWIDKKIFAKYGKSLEDCIKHIESIPGVVKFSLISYQDPTFPAIYKEYMESGKYTREEYDDKMEEILGPYVDE